MRALVELANQSGKPVVLDCSGAALQAVLESPHKPTVIKPNNEELSQLLGREVSKDLDELKEVLQEPLLQVLNGLSFHLVPTVPLPNMVTLSTR